MFERFTERARRVVVFAQEEARDLNHSYIGTEHLLLGLMRDADSVAAQALQELEISQDAVREQVTEIIGRGERSPSGHIPFTPRAKKVLELSLREALQLNHNYIGTEHILLGLVGEGEGVAAQVLVKLGGSLSRVRDKVIELAPPGTGEGPELSSQLRRSRLRGPLDELMRRLEAMDERLAAIERHLGLAGGLALRRRAGPRRLRGRPRGAGRRTGAGRQARAGPRAAAGRRGGPGRRGGGRRRPVREFRQHGRCLNRDHAGRAAAAVPAHTGHTQAIRWRRLFVGSGPVIGVLGLQGDVVEHARALAAAGASPVTVRRADELDRVDGLVIPGGESTTMWKLAVIFDLMDPLRKRTGSGMCVFGSCAGMIMLADRLLDGVAGQETVGGIDMTVRRNAFGRQVDSFESDISLAGIARPPVQGGLHPRSLGGGDRRAGGGSGDRSGHR